MRNIPSDPPQAAEMSQTPPSLVTCYYYAPHNHCLRLEHLDADLAHMAELGTTDVAFCVQEDQLGNWHSQRLATVVERIHRQGMRAVAVPNRWCGLTAGWLDGYSAWSLQNTALLLPGHERKGICDPGRGEVRERMLQSLEQLVQRLPIDALVWDEPAPLAPVIALLDELAGVGKKLKPGLRVDLFLDSGHVEQAASALLATRHLDHLGSDGHVRAEQHRMHRMKPTIFHAHAVLHPLLRQAGRRSVFLLEGQRHRDADLEAYLAVFDQALALPMEQIMWYYTAHEMSPAAGERFDAATWAGIARLARRQRT
jgi:hypothetical protein